MARITKSRGQSTKERNRIRTRGGICLGDHISISGMSGVHMVQGKKEEDLLPEDIVEAITGREVEIIVFKDEMVTAAE